MISHTFKLTFEYDHERAGQDAILQALARAGCADAMVSLGRPGLVGFVFCRRGEDLRDVRNQAIADVQKALPGARLVHKACPADKT